MLHKINLEKFKTFLKFNGVDLSDFSDEEIETLIEFKIRELEGFVGADIYPHERTKVISKFYDDSVQLNFYPVVQVAKVFVNDEVVPHSEFNINHKLGMIYFKKFMKGVVKVQYVSGVTDRDFDYIILPLLRDMVSYTISFGKMNSSVGGFGYLASSLKEGDLSISFSNGNIGGSGGYGYSAPINSKIDELRKSYKYTARVRLL